MSRRDVTSTQRTYGPQIADGGTEIAALKRRVAALEAQIRSVTSASAPTNGQRTPNDHPVPKQPAQATRYLRFRTPAALRAQQDEAGNLSIFNSDGALTGQVLVIQGIDEAGNEVPLTITVPAP